MTEDGLATDTGVRLLPTDPRDMTPTAVAWARSVLTVVCTIPRAELPAPSRTSLTAVVWTLAGAADWLCTVPGDYTAAVLAREAEVGDRVWQKRTAWLRQHGFLQHGRRGARDGWQLVPPSEAR
ncbi:hypothetical protein [Kineococcus sp. SYSU DK006]|uniref:hypothetical protein n=1 Tax=Kineococcus sp. SYSU DK006 TaxID=3383127 RepID=UPI003D7DFE66